MENRNSNNQTTVIIADDEPITRMDLKEIFQSHGYNVVAEASDGFDAVESCKKYHPDLILLDVKMPLADGLSAAKIINEDNLADTIIMKHKDVNLILATGGSAMVHAAYESGTPAIGVGPGNGPAYIDRSCDLPLAVKRIMDSKTFDHGLICASEQSIVCDEDMAPAVEAEFKKQGAYFLSDEECAKLGKFILRANGTMATFDGAAIDDGYLEEIRRKDSFSV